MCALGVIKPALKTTTVVTGTAVFTQASQLRNHMVQKCASQCVEAAHSAHITHTNLTAHISHATPLFETQTLQTCKIKQDGKALWQQHSPCPRNTISKPYVHEQQHRQ